MRRYSSPPFSKPLVWLAAALLLPPAGLQAAVEAGSPGARCGGLVKPEPHRFVLLPSGKVARASGLVNLIPAWSPFGLAVSSEGSFVYDLAITVDGLPDPRSLGGYTMYVAWLATPSLDRVQNLGPIKNGDKLTLTADWNKMMVVITAEAALGANQWAGTIVLSGRSPSARLENFAGHDLFSTGTPLC